MDILNLKEGQVIKNYIELCKLLDVEPTRGKGRDYHIREFERYCKYHKQGQKFIIDEVYAEPLEKIDGRINNGKHKLIYDDLMDKLIINMLICYGDVDISFNKLVNKYIDLFTVEYEKMLKVGYEQYAKKHNITKGLVLTYQQNLRNILSTLLKTSLNRLQRNGIITWEKNIEYIDTKCDRDFADEKLTKEINLAKKKIMQEMGIDHKSLSYPNTYKKYVKNVCKELDNVINFWNVFSIRLIKDVEKPETDLDELKRRLIKQLHISIRKYERKGDFGNVFYPYMSETNKQDTIRLDKLLWRLPKDYINPEDDIDLDFYYEDDIDFEKAVPF